MAEQKSRDVRQSFSNVQFSKMEDPFDVQVRLNANMGTLSLSFVNKTNTNTYARTFSKEDVEGITTKCQLSPEHLCQLIIDQLSSPAFIDKFCRVFVFAESKQGTVVCRLVSLL